MHMVHVSSLGPLMVQQFFAILGENLLRYCTIPRKVCRSFRVVGFGISPMALTFAVLGLHPCVV